MIKKLRRRFVFVNMSILTCVMLGVLTAVFLLMYRSEVRVSEEIMDSIIASNTQGAPPPPPREGTTEPLSAQPSENGVTPLGRWEEQPVQTTAPPYREDHPHTDAPDYRPDDGWKPPYDPNCPPYPYYPFPPWLPPWQTTTAPTITTTQQTRPTETRPPKRTETKPPAKTTTVPPKQTTPAPATVQTTVKTTTAAARTTTVVVTTERTTITTRRTTVTTVTTTTAPPETAPVLAETRITDGSFARSSIFIRLGDDKKIEDVNAQFTDQGNLVVASEAVQKVFDKGRMRGKIQLDDVEYRYRLLPEGGDKSYSLVLLDRSIELSTLSRLLFIFLIIGAIGLLLIFGISVALASWTIQPIDLAWEKQKRFVADASHELKTPLAVISTNTDVILANPDDTVRNQEKWLHYIKDETARMSKLVSNLLFIAKSDAKQMTPAMKAFDLSDLVASVCLVFEPLAFEHGKTLETMIQSGICCVGDNDRIKQLLTILLDNAVIHSTEHALITVTLSQDAQNKIRIVVSNAAHTIPADQLERLFDRFYRLDESRAKRTGGSGLGLNIARTIVENHGGTLVAHSENETVSFIATMPEHG